MPSRHFHSAESLQLYEASLLPAFERQVLSDLDELNEQQRTEPLGQFGFIILTPSPALALHSSLVHMSGTVRRAFGSRGSIFAGGIAEDGAWTLDFDAALFALRKSMCANHPVVLLGTAFSFVHLLDHFEARNICYRPPEGSRVMETGGYKGRSRSLPKPKLHALISKHLGVPESRIICEYGMSELGSQAYDWRVTLGARTNYLAGNGRTRQRGRNRADPHFRSGKCVVGNGNSDRRPGHSARERI